MAGMAELLLHSSVGRSKVGQQEMTEQESLGLRTEEKGHRSPYMKEEDEQD